MTSNFTDCNHCNFPRLTRELVNGKCLDCIAEDASEPTYRLSRLLHVTNPPTERFNG